MPVTTILFDLDETLMIEDASVDDALIAACSRVARALSPRLLAGAIRRRAREIWYAHPSHPYCRNVGISSWEGLWGDFSGDDPNLEAIQAWVPEYRATAWNRALADFGVEDEQLARTLSDRFIEERRARHILFPDAFEVLQSLASSHKLGIVTNGAPAIQGAKIAAARIARFFDAVVISGELGVGKPEPRVFEVALERLGANPADAAMVGDKLERDVLGAQRAGIRAVWLNRGGGPDTSARPDAEIGSLTELSGLLARFDR